MQNGDDNSIVMAMTNLNLEQALEVTRSAVTEVGEILAKHYGNIEADTKSDTGSNVTDIVTKLDVQMEDLLAERLGKFDSRVGFRGEESGVRSEADTTWLVDPIDGTSHFVRGLPFCTTMVALIEDGKVMLSVIHDFVHSDTYWAIRGKGAFKNDTPITVSQRPLNKSLISFETHLEKPENCEKYLAVRTKAGIIATISCGFEFAMIASGKLDGRIGLDPYGMDWDFAPGSLLVSEAGGVATNIGSSEYDYRNHNYLITNALVHDELTSGSSPIFPIKSS
jgi:myo-inositol-1(or 4)-monophosphatase